MRKYKTKKRYSKRRKGGGSFVKRSLKKGKDMITNNFKNLSLKKANYYYNKNMREQKNRIPYDPKNDSVLDSINIDNRFGEFMNAFQAFNKDYPGILDEFIWYSSLTGDAQKEVEKKYKKSGFNLQLWHGNFPQNELIHYSDDSYGYKGVSWKCTLPGDKYRNIALGYSFSCQYYIFIGPEKHWIKSKNFAGPATRVELRASKYWPLHPLLMSLSRYDIRGSYPFNEPVGHIDSCARDHDMSYSIRGNNSLDIQNADYAMLKCAESAPPGADLDDKFKNFLVKSAIQGKLAGETIIGDGAFGIVDTPVTPEDLKKYPRSFNEYKKLLGDIEMFQK